jgi:hypothetical protein
MPSEPTFVRRPFGWMPVLPLLAALTLCSSLARAQPLAPVPSVAPIGNAWPVGTGFQFADAEKKTRRSVSGMACAPNALRASVCLLVFDEGMEARFAELGAGQLVPLPGGVRFAVPGKELDAEAAATDGRFFYVAGSHAVKRGDCASNPSSRHVLRFGRDPTTGRALAAAAGGDLPAGYQHTTRLLALMEANAQLSDGLRPGRCLGAGGVDIEAMALRGGRLHVGLRGPTDGGHAYIASVDAEALFGQADAALQVTRVSVGGKRGLRDMATASNGMLLLAGPDDHRDSADAGWAIMIWNDQTAPGQPAETRTLATLDLSKVGLSKCDKETKPEALAVLQETATAYRVLVLSDGMCDGGPLQFDIPR